MTGQNSTENGTDLALTCLCSQSATYRQLDRSCPQHGDAADARRRQHVNHPSNGGKP